MTRDTSDHEGAGNTDDRGARLQRIDDVLRLVDREVWIITAADGERRGGLLATWVSQSSLDTQTPVLTIALAPNHFTTELVLASGAFAAHLVAEDHIGLAWPFALGSGRDRDKLAELDFSPGETGSPRLANALAWLDCRVIARYETGDRIFFWADIVDGDQAAAGDPVRVSTMMASADDQQRAALRADLERDIELQRPLADRWRESLRSP
ncbi:MAG: flavin reductase [Planctomycetota bacterium]|nr:MAG: flavin reductase [Planctomycetota bacterium]REK21729.1 MAG: flavin reductase [Planctomycetota bacterium]REK43135.1 MAG: flavin reductase [Planctomycetota bacterium]